MKNKWINKGLAILMSVSMFFSALPVWSYAEEPTTKTDIVSGDIKAESSVSTDLYGKAANELAQNVSFSVNDQNKTITASGEVSYVTGYTGFWSDNAEQQNGYYLPFKLNIDSKFTKATVQLNTFMGWKDVNPVSDDIVFRLGNTIAEAKGKQMVLKIDLDGEDDVYQPVEYTVITAHMNYESTARIEKIVPLNPSWSDQFEDRKETTAGDFASNLSFNVDNENMVITVKGDLNWIEHYQMDYVYDANNYGYYIPFQAITSRNDVAYVRGYCGYYNAMEWDGYENVPGKVILMHLYTSPNDAVNYGDTARIVVGGINGETVSYKLDVSGLTLNSKIPGQEPYVDIKVNPNNAITIAKAILKGRWKADTIMVTAIKPDIQSEGPAKTAFEAATKFGEVLGFYDIKLTDLDGENNFELLPGESLELTLTLGKEFANQDLVIRHYDSNTGQFVEEYKVKADAEGNVTFEVTSLSFFAVQKVSGSSNPKTGDNNQVYILMSLMVITGAITLILRKAQLAK